jgi:DNA replication initiation complex subunit (GINS family)
MLVTSAETAEGDLSRRSSIMKTGEKTVTGGTASAKRKMMVSTPSFLLPDEKGLLEDHTATLERQNERLKAKLVEMETAQRTRTKTKATIATLKNKSNNLEEEQRAGSLKV